jgi:hypothetical protein
VKERRTTPRNFDLRLGEAEDEEGDMEVRRECVDRNCMQQICYRYLKLYRNGACSTYTPWSKLEYNRGPVICIVSRSVKATLRLLLSPHLCHENLSLLHNASGLASHSLFFFGNLFGKKREQIIQYNFTSVSGGKKRA